MIRTMKMTITLTMTMVMSLENVAVHIERGDDMLWTKAAYVGYVAQERMLLPIVAESRMLLPIVAETMLQCPCFKMLLKQDAAESKCCNVAETMLQCCNVYAETMVMFRCCFNV